VARVRHDLVKRLLWVARDCRDSSRAPTPGELITTLYDDEGQPIDALSLWLQLLEQAPACGSLDEFGRALGSCVEAARRNDLAGVLALETAFERLRVDLASSLNETGSMGSTNRKAR
jgi:hypothetical protein